MPVPVSALEDFIELRLEALFAEMRERFNLGRWELGDDPALQEKVVDAAEDLMDVAVELAERYAAPRTILFRGAVYQAMPAEELQEYADQLRLRIDEINEGTIDLARLAREAEDVASDLEGWLRRNRVIAPLAIVLRGARYELADSGLYGYGGGGRRPYYRRMLYRLRRSMDRATGPELEAMIDAIEDLQERQREVDEE